jgi:hypothetical protein
LIVLIISCKATSTRHHDAVGGTNVVGHIDRLRQQRLADPLDVFCEK